MGTWFRQWLCMVPGVVLAGYIVDGIEFDEPWKLLLVAGVLSLLNVFIRPLLIFFTLPFIVLTFGLGIFIINALLLYLAGTLVPGFYVLGFGAALLGSLLASFINLIVSALFGSRGSRASFRVQRRRGPRGIRQRAKDDVIDV